MMPRAPVRRPLADPSAMVASDTTWSWCPDYDVGAGRERRVLEAPFGDGYSQRLDDGLNSVRGTFTLSFSNRRLAAVRAMDQFLIDVGAGAFNLTLPGSGEVLRVTCDTWQVTYVGRISTGAVLASLTATFTQAFGL